MFSPSKHILLFGLLEHLLYIYYAMNLLSLHTIMLSEVVTPILTSSNVTTSDPY